MLVAGLYDEDHEANGLSCFNEMCEVVESFDVPLFEVKNRDQSGKKNAATFLFKKQPSQATDN